MDSIPQNEDIDESDSYSQDCNEISTNSLQNSVDNEEYSEIQIEANETSQKPTFKNTWLAKKRLQAFSSQKQLPMSPSTKNKFKTILVNEKIDNEKGELQGSLNHLKRPPKKGETPIDKARAVIEEIELLKKIELFQSTPATIEEKLSSISCTRRSRSKSSERDFVFRKREKKVRNYRRSDTSRRSPSPVISKPKKEKPTEKTNNYKYPRNWEEFKRDKWTFGKLLSKVSHSSVRNITNDISRQLQFETPAETIKSFYYKDEKGGEILVPYQFLRYTSAKPKVSYNVNFNNIKENFLNREQILNKTNKNYREILEKFLGRNTRSKFRTAEPIGQRNWYQRNWKDNESRVLETSIGLSFLQNYSDDEDDEEEDVLTFESPRITKIQEMTLENKQEIKETKSEDYLEEGVKNADIRFKEKEERSPEMIVEEIKCHEHKEIESQPSQKTDKKKDSVSTPSPVKEQEIVRNRTESESFHEEMVEKIDASWTPERIEQTYDTMWDETPKKKKEKLIQENRRSKRVDSNCENIEDKQRAREIHSEDEWDETPKRKKEKSILEEEEHIKKSKKKQNRKRSDSESSSDERQKFKRKKKKLDRKRKQKEKIKKARKKKEKMRAEKLKLKKEKKRKQKERAKEVVEKEILKKLKKEIEHNLEEVEREERENNKSEQIIEMPVTVKIEKVDDYEKDVRPPEDLRNYLDKKIGKVKDLREKVKGKRQKKKEKGTTKIKNDKKESFSEEVMVVDEPINREIKPERLSKDKHKEVKKFDVIDKIENAKEEEVEEVFPLEKEIEEPETVEHNKIEQIQEIGNGAQNESDAKGEEAKNKIKSKEEVACETTPDTDEYHSNWESDEGVSPVVKMASKKDRSWESDEEIFDRSYAKKKEAESGPLSESPALEMPLHLKKFSRRRRDSKNSGIRQRPRSPEYLDVDNEIKLLEAERLNLSKERMQLEIEKIRIHELEREKSMEEVEYIGEPPSTPNWQSEAFRKTQNRRHSRWDLREDLVDSSTSRDRQEKIDTQRSRSVDKGIDSVQGFDGVKSSQFPCNADVSLSSNTILSVSSSPEITSTESPKPTVLESAYEEFMRAVTTDDFLVISSADSDPPEAAGKNSTGQKKTRLTRSERDRNRERCVKRIETSREGKIHGITDPNLLRDILLPGEEVPVEQIPMPVPSPKVEIMQNLAPTLVMNVIPAAAVPEPICDVNTSQDSQESIGKSSGKNPSKKLFSFSTLVLPKKQVLLEKSNWKLDEDSDEEPPPLKKKLEDFKIENSVAKENIEENPKSIEEPTRQSDEVGKTCETAVIDKKEELIVEKTKDSKEKDKRRDAEDKRKDDRSSKRKDSSRSRSPADAPKEKRRRDEDSRRREEDQRRRDEDARRKGEDARRREEDTRRKDNDKKRKEDENRRRDSDSRKKEEDVRKKEDETKRRERDKRTLSPQRHRESSPRRRRNSSPLLRRSSPRHNRSPPRRQDSLRRTDRRSPLPSRSSPARRKRSHSPNRRGTAIRRRSSGSKEKSPRHYHHHMRKSKSPRHSPMDGLKRSLADSTISDDLLPQPYLREEASDSPLSSSTSVIVSKKARITASPKRPSLDERISQVLGVENQPAMCWKPEEPQKYLPTQESMYLGYHQQQESLLAMGPSTSSMAPITSKVVQVGNILQVVPTEELSIPPTPHFSSVQKIVQVGNMLQIVPTEMEVILPPLPPPPPPKESPPHEVTPIGATLPEKQSAEAILAAKNAERLAERAKKRKEKEERKKEKEKKRKEREKKRKMQLRISTEEVIKRALEMDGLIIDENEDLSALVPEIVSDTPGLDPSKSILMNSTSRYLDPVNKMDRGKSVQFADGVRPGEGTSPSGGEELSSPPPQTEDLPKAKRYRKMEAAKKKKKRKIKVKVVKKRLSTPDHEYENLPPPSPPPGSPPPHVFPPRVKVHTINNIPQHYLPSYGITTAPQQSMIGQPPPVMNLGYPASGGGVYRPPQPAHVNVIGQHYARAAHAQAMGGHIHSSPQLVHSHLTTAMTHREHQPYGSF